jgi:probable HAF family extracellular repeat protein
VPAQPIQDIGPFGTQANGINASGQIVGYYFDADGHEHGFLLDQGSYTTLDMPGWQDTFAEGINGSRQIVGFLGNDFLGSPSSLGCAVGRSHYRVSR